PCLTAPQPGSVPYLAAAAPTTITSTAFVTRNRSMPFVARMLMCSTVVGLALALVVPSARPGPAQSERIVYLAHDLADEQLIVLGSALAAWRPDSVLLLDSTKISPYLKSFLAAYKPAQVISIGDNADD